MDGGGLTTAPEPAARRTLTPAVLGASAFVAICAVLSVAFVAARGGLELPLASASAPPVAVATPGTPAPSIPEPSAATSPAVASPTAVASPSSPSSSPSSSSQPPVGPTPTPDPLTALPGCPDRAGCYVYTVRRGDTLGRIADRYGIPFSTVVALNPEVGDPSVIVLGQPIYLGRDPFARLERCPNRDACYLYVILPGDRLSTIAGRFGVTMTAILELNPAIDDPNEIFSGQVIRLPDPTP